ncbi:hypothetical protein BZA77DRAFT_296356 [Pyronema omphalodes]|nr:hypothetical protein BZA77DRAFT_296356 [Pyronema omphalodes]
MRLRLRFAASSFLLVFIQNWTGVGFANNKPRSLTLLPLLPPSNPSTFLTRFSLAYGEVSANRIYQSFDTPVSDCPANLQGSWLVLSTAISQQGIWSVLFVPPNHCLIIQYGLMNDARHRLCFPTRISSWSFPDPTLDEDGDLPHQETERQAPTIPLAVINSMNRLPTRLFSTLNGLEFLSTERALGPLPKTTFVYPRIFRRGFQKKSISFIWPSRLRHAEISAPTIF